MKTTLAFAAFLVLATVSAGASADTTKARCKVMVNGEVLAPATGKCTFSQRQGNVDIELKNGKTHSLRAGDAANQFLDEKGRKVKREVKDGKHIYKFPNSTIVVSFEADGESQQSESSSRQKGEVGATPGDLRDLVNGRLVGGEVDDELGKRGYKHVRNSTSGHEVWSNWKSKSTKQCVSVHFKNGKVRSIVNAPDADCR